MAYTLVEANGDGWVDTATNLAISFPICMVGWINKGTAETGRICGLYDDGSTGTRHELLFNTSEAVAAFSTGGTATTTVTGSADTWEHCAGVWAAVDDRTAYINGADGVNNTGSDTVDESAMDLYVGSRGSVNHFDGLLAEVAIWSGVDITPHLGALAAGYSPLFFSAGLVLYMPLLRGINFDVTGTFAMTEEGTPSGGEHPPIIYPEWFSELSVAEIASGFWNPLIRRQYVPQILR